jgi:hypothetical protein
MTHYRCWAGLVVLLFARGPVLGETAKTDRYRGADELAGRIDRLLGDAWKKANVTPARPAEDAEWLRRVYLDVIGRIPSVAESRSFLADRRTDKRKRLVETLLASQRYPTWFAGVWRGLLLPEANTNIQLRLQGPNFERWLRNWLASENGADWVVRELMTATIEGRGPRILSPSPVAVFYTAKENKPEELAATAASVFLGVNLQCAQCHNHPFAQWKKEQFWSFAAFFSDGRGPVDGRRGGRESVGRARLRIPGTDKVVKAKYLDGKEPTFENGTAVRRVLTDWMTAKDNPYFAKALVNRYWAHFFGTGLVEPLDAMVGTESTPSHPAILEELAQGFTKEKYDLRWLIRAITATKAYHLSSARSHDSQDEPRQFGRMALRGLIAEQLFDSIVQATGFRDDSPAGANRLNLGGARNTFLGKFAASDRATETQTSILQALTLMNGQVMTAVTSTRRSETLVAVVESPFLNLPGKIEALYLAALSRPPTAKELTRMVRYVEKATSGSEASSRKAEALADVFWALLNSAEFAVNH